MAIHPATLDDLIDDWHQGKSNQTLAQFLGMTPEEYAHWVKTCELPERLQYLDPEHP